MGSFLLLLQPILLLLFVQGVGAFVYSCEEVKYKLINANSAPKTNYACIITKEGFTNMDQLKKISAQVDKDSTSFADIANSASSCVQNKAGNSPWKIVAATGFSLNCDQEFTLIFTSDSPTFIKPLKKKTVHSVQKQRIFAVPQVGMWLRTKGCSGEGNVKFWTGAGTGESEQRYALRSWTCDTLPDYICLFDNVVTVEVDDSINYSAESTTAQDLNSNISPTPRENIVVIVNGRSDNLQNLKGTEHTAYVGIKNDEKTDITVDMQLVFDPTNTGTVQIQKSFAGKLYPFKNGTYSEKFNSDYFEIRWLPTGLQASAISNNKDNIFVEITMNKPSPAPVGNGEYCACDVDKTGFAKGWNYNEIWLDIVIILDTSEAMTTSALNDAASLIESLFSNGAMDFLSTDSKASFYTRVGLIAMSDDADVLYNLNMTKKSKVQGKVSIKKGVDEIDVVYGFTAALNMFHDGLSSKPERSTTRQVIYYMTSTDPSGNLNSLNQFKESGVVIVSNFANGGKDLAGLKKLASDGFYSTKNSNMQSLQSFCKGNCYCTEGNFAYTGADPALKASGGCFHPDLSGLTFSKAKTQCSKDGGIIASIHDKSKGIFMQELMAKAKSDYFWIGYEKSDDGFWSWEDKSTNPYTNWDVDEPSESTSSKCGYADKTEATVPWGAGNCQVSFPYVCEVEPCKVGSNDC